MFYHLKNLMEFCVMLGDNKAPEDQVNLELVTWTTKNIWRILKHL